MSCVKMRPLWRVMIEQRVGKKQGGVAGELWARGKLSKLSHFSGMEQFINLRILNLSLTFLYICQDRRIEHILVNSLIA